MELIEAVKSGDYDRVKEMVIAGIDINGHGEEQEWTPLNYVAGNGDLKMVKFFIENGADVFNVGRDKRTPYMIALAAGRVEVAKFLREIEEKVDMEKCRDSSKRERKYCKAYHLRDLHKFSGWTDSKINWKEDKDTDEGDKTEGGDKEFSDDNVVFIHQDFTVTQSMYHNENVIYNNITSEWRQFLEDDIQFKVPDDLDLIVPNEDEQEKVKANQS